MCSCSVVIPFFRRHKTILRAVKSALSLPFVIEVIIVDDDPLSDLDPSIFYRVAYRNKIKIIKNGLTKGAQGARVFGATTATSELILFLDSDDALLKQGSLGLFSEMRLSKNLAMAYGNVICNSKPSDFLRLKGYCFNKIIKNLCLCPFSGLMVRKSLVQWNKLDLTLPAWQDDDFVLTVSMNGEIAFCDFFTAEMFPSVDSISNSKSKQFKGLTILLRKWQDEIFKLHGFKYLILWRLRQIRLFFLTAAQLVENRADHSKLSRPSLILFSKVFRLVARVVTFVVRPFFDRIYA